MWLIDQTVRTANEWPVCVRMRCIFSSLSLVSASLKCNVISVPFFNIFLPAFWMEQSQHILNSIVLMQQSGTYCCVDWTLNCIESIGFNIENWINWKSPFQWARQLDYHQFIHSILFSIMSFFFYKIPINNKFNIIFFVKKKKWVPVKPLCHPNAHVGTGLIKNLNSFFKSAVTECCAAHWAFPIF